MYSQMKTTLEEYRWIELCEWHDLEPKNIDRWGYEYVPPSNKTPGYLLRRCLGQVYLDKQTLPDSVHIKR